jgi:hypothetical protein
MTLSHAVKPAKGARLEPLSTNSIGAQPEPIKNPDFPNPKNLSSFCGKVQSNDR